MAVLLMAGVLSVPQGGSILAQAAEEPETATAAESLSTANIQRSGEEKWKVLLLQKWKMLKNRWVTVKKKKYYLGADGAAKTGWYTIGAKTYYFGTTGVMNSRFTKSVSADLRKVITSVDRIAKSQKITYKTGTNTALLKLYNYMRNTCKYGREDFPAASQKGWVSLMREKC